MGNFYLIKLTTGTLFGSIVQCIIMFLCIRLTVTLSRLSKHTVHKFLFLQNDNIVLYRCHLIIDMKSQVILGQFSKYKWTSRKGVYEWVIYQIFHNQNTSIWFMLKQVIWEMLKQVKPFFNTVICCFGHGNWCNAFWVYT